jgi:hypothetical protein
VNGLKVLVVFLVNQPIKELSFVNSENIFFKVEVRIRVNNMFVEEDKIK